MSMIWAGGLKYDTGRYIIAQPFREVTEASGCVGKTGRAAVA